MDYKILKEKNPATLEQSVNNYIDKGYMPAGGVVVYPDKERNNKEGKWTEFLWYIQAVALLVPPIVAKHMMTENSLQEKMINCEHRSEGYCYYLSTGDTPTPCIPNNCPRKEEFLNDTE